jgi:hypothetical protein
MSVAKKAGIGVAAVLMSFASAAPSFADLKIDGIAGESKDEGQKGGIHADTTSAAPVCIYLLGTVVCVSQ